MKKMFLFLVFCLFGASVYSQIRTVEGGYVNPNKNSMADKSMDSLNRGEVEVILDGKTKYTDYKIISHKRDTTLVDTTLTLQKQYQFNFLRKDDFELLAFHNQGQTFNSLAYDFSKNSVIPDIGFTAKQFNYIGIEDVKYYQVPTPTTEIMYRTGLEQGQVVDAIFTANFSKRLNVAMAYKGLRSLGAYRRSLSSTGNFRVSFHYETPESQYTIRGHAVNQDFLNQESGGLTDVAMEYFLNDDPTFSNDRGRLDVNFNDAESLFESKRLYFEHDFKILSSKDSLHDKDFSNIKIGHAFTRDSKYFTFSQATPSDLIDVNRVTGSVNNRTNYLLYDNQLFLDFNSKYVLGRFRVKTAYKSYVYGYESLQNNTVSITRNQLKGNAVSFGADWNGRINHFFINATASITPGSARLAGNDFYAEALYKKDSLFTVKARLKINNRLPNFNFQLLQSNYNKYNWETDMASVGTRVLGGEIATKWGSASLDITNINNHTFFNEEGLPSQYDGPVNYLKVKVSKEFKIGKFALDNTLMYQKVADGTSVLRVPDFVTRNTFYYGDNWFKGDPIYVQIGATFKYFSKYNANAFNPLIGEFAIQNDTEIGYPMLDLFFNGRVKRTRIYFKADNVSSFFLKKNYLSAPNYPYRDFVIRFGLVWNWFI